MVLRVGPFKQFFSIEKCCLPISEVLNNNKTEQNKTNPSRKKKNLYGCVRQISKHTVL